MSTTIVEVPPNGTGPASANFVEEIDVQDIWVDYDETTEEVTVNPGGVHKGTTVRFRDPKGGKLRIEFLLPDGKAAETVLDSQWCTMTVGGTYHFKCHFTRPGTQGETSPERGGVIDVIPQRP